LILPASKNKGINIAIPEEPKMAPEVGPLRNIVVAKAPKPAPSPDPIDSTIVKSRIYLQQLIISLLFLCILPEPFHF